MKKQLLYSMFVVLLLAMAPFALADDSDESTADTDDTTTEKKSKDMQEERQKLIERKKNLMAQAREVRDGVKEHVKAFREARKGFAESREAAREARKAAQSCKGRDVPQCIEARKEAKTKTKDFLATSSSEAIEMLNKAKQRVSESNMPDDKKAEILAKLDERIAALTKAKENADTLTEQSKPEEFKASAKTVQNAWKESRQDLKKAVVKANHAKLGNIAERLAKAQEKLKTLVDKLAAEGKDTSSLKTELDAVQAKLDAVKALNEELSTIVSADELETAEKMKQATAKMQEANKALKEAHQLVKSLVANIRKA